MKARPIKPKWKMNVNKTEKLETLYDGRYDPAGRAIDDPMERTDLDAGCPLDPLMEITRESGAT